MPRDSNGTYTLPAGNPVISGAIIESNWANTTMPDIGNELSDSLSRSGEGGMLSQFKKIDGNSGAPGDSWTNELTSGWYRAGANDFRFAIATNDIFRFVSGGAQLWNGSSWDNVSTGLPGDYLPRDGSQPMTGDIDMDGNGIVDLKIGSFGPPSGTDLSLNIVGDDSGLFGDGAGVIGLVSNADNYSTASQLRLTDTEAFLDAATSWVRCYNASDATFPDTIRFSVGGNPALMTLRDPYLDMETNLIKNAGDPVDPQDLVTMAYADANYEPLGGGSSLLVDGSNFMTGNTRIDENMALASDGSYFRVYETLADGTLDGVAKLDYSAGSLALRTAAGSTYFQLNNSALSYSQDAQVAFRVSNSSGEQIFETRYTDNSNLLYADEDEFIYRATNFAGAELHASLNSLEYSQGGSVTCEFDASGSTLNSTLQAENHTSGALEDVLTTSDLPEVDFYDASGGRDNHGFGTATFKQVALEANTTYKVTWMVDAQQQSAGTLDFDFVFPGTSTYSLWYRALDAGGAGTPRENFYQATAVSGTIDQRISDSDTVRYIVRGEMEISVGGTGGNLEMQYILASATSWDEGMSYLKAERLD